MATEIDSWDCRCGQKLKTFLPAPGHQPGRDVNGTCYADGEYWPCEATIRKHEEVYHTCTCPNVHLGNEVVGKNINDNCPDHGLGTEYYRKNARYWSDRLTELRERKKGR